MNEHLFQPMDESVIIGCKPELLNELSIDTAYNAMKKVGEKLRTTAYKHRDLANKRVRLSQNFTNYFNNKIDGKSNPAAGISERMNKLKQMGYPRHHRGVSTDIRK